MDAPEAPPSSDSPPNTAADTSLSQQSATFPSDAPLAVGTPSNQSTSTPLISVSLPSSSTTSLSQPQSHPSQLQRQPIAARTRSQTLVGQSPFAQPLSTLSSSSSAAPLLQRSGLAIGAQALHSHLARPPSSAGYPFGSSSHFSQPLMGSSSPSPSFNQPFSGFPRSCLSLAEQSSGSNPPSSSFSQPFSGMPRPSAGMLEPLTSNSQKFSNPGLPKPSSMPSLIAPISASQSAQSLQQQWMSSQGKQSHGPPFPSSSHRKLYTSQQSPQQQQQHSPPPTPTHLQPSSSQQQQQKQLPQSQQHSHLQDLHSNKSQQPLSQQHHQAVRSHSLLTQKSNNQPGQSVDNPEIGSQILQKRSIQELLAQIDPYEKLEADVEDVLMEIADDFVESITTAACSLAKHRKSTALEAKDVLLYVERNWNITLPGFGGDDIKLYKKPHTNDIHKERLAMIKKSMGMVSDFAGPKNAATAQIVASTKALASKASPALVFASPK